MAEEVAATWQEFHDQTYGPRMGDRLIILNTQRYLGRIYHPDSEAVGGRIYDFR